MEAMREAMRETTVVVDTDVVDTIGSLELTLTKQDMYARSLLAFRDRKGVRRMWMGKTRTMAMYISGRR